MQIGKLPNVRKLFLPDPGHMICDVDLSGADAQVVAWESSDVDLKRAFTQGLDIHDHNGRAIWGSNYNRDAKPRKHTMRDELKRAVHGTNYAAGARTLSTTLGWSQGDVRSFQNAWFRLHPFIAQWQRRVDHQLQTTRRVSNLFGYRRYYFDRPDNLLPEGLAWIPQSTIACVTSRALLAMRRAISWAEVLLQVHDSLIFQLPFHRYTNASMAQIKQAISIPVPYPGDPLLIPWGLSASAESWGAVKKLKWDEIPG